MTFCLCSCAPTRQAPQAAYSTKYSKTKATGLVSGVNCQSEKAFSCSLRRFSPDLENKSYSSSPVCQMGSDGKKVCAAVKVYQFDTQAGVEDCTDCSAESKQERYLNSEAICVYHGLIQNDIYGVRGQGENLTEALSNAYAACLSNKDINP